MTDARAKPQPALRGEERRFFEAAAERRLLIQRCGACDRAIFIPRSVCPFCHAAEPAWIEAAGTGSVYSFTILHRSGLPGFETDVPYVVALIDLVEGVRMMGNLVDVDHGRLHIGMPVQVVWEDRPSGPPVPQWRPASSAAEET